MIRILFVCTANVCRSPYLELRARHLIGSDLADVASGGTHSLPDREMDPLMAAELAKRGQSTSNHRSRQVTNDLLTWADAVLGVTADHRTTLLGQRPDLARKVFTLGQFMRGAEAAEDDADDLVLSAFRHRGGMPTGDDLADPYGRGPEAATSCAARSDDYLNRLRDLLQRRSAVQGQ